MLNQIISLSLRNRALVLGAALLVLVLGLWTTRHMDVDVFPDLGAPTVVILTEARGMATEQVERQVSYPIETALQGGAGVRCVRSTSTTGFSAVQVEFDWGTDIHRARQAVSEKLATLSGTLPPEAGTPTLGPLSSILGEVYLLGLTVDTTPAHGSQQTARAAATTPGQLRRLADRTLRPALLATGGVASVSVLGGEQTEWQLRVSPQRLRHYGVSLTQVLAAVRGMNADASGATLSQRGSEYEVSARLSTTDPAELGRALVLSRQGAPSVTLADVATIATGPSQPPMGTASVSGRPAVLLTVTKQPGTNTLALTERLDSTVARLSAALPHDVRTHTHLYRQQDFIEASVGNIRQSLLEGGLFVVLVLFLFLGNVRTTLISLVTIPLSLLVTLLILRLSGLTVNTMSIGGMAIAIGSLVDDAIVDVENVYRHLRANASLPRQLRRPRLQVIYEASREVRLPILNSTLIIVVSFVPLFFLSGLEGRMLVPLGVSFIAALAASTLVALTLTPVLCSYLLRPAPSLQPLRTAHSTSTCLGPAAERAPRAPGAEPRLVRVMRAGYVRLLTWCLPRRRAVLCATLALVVVSLGLFFTLGSSFLPPFNEGSFTINVSAMPGTSLQQSDALGAQAERLIMQVPEVREVARKTGRAELDEHALGTNVSEMEVPFTLAGRSKEQVASDLRQRLAQLPGAVVEIGQPITHRIDAMLSGTRAAVAVKVFGPDLATLRRLGLAIQRAVADVPGLTDLTVEPLVERPVLELRPRRTLLAQAGISLPEFSEYVRAAVAGEQVGTVTDATGPYPLTLRMDLSTPSAICPAGTHSPPQQEADAAQLGLLPVQGADGRSLPLEQVADVVSTTGPSTVSHENGQRKLVVSTGVTGRDLRSAVDEMRRRVAQHVELPEGYRVEFGGQFENAEQASRLLLLTSLLSLLVILLLLFLQFRSWMQSLLVLSGLPLALIGGVLALRLGSGVVSIPAIIGFISLLGIATRGGMLLVDRYNALALHGHATRRRAVLVGSGERLLPIVMTALTSALALVPLALRGAQPGGEIQSPMAVVILGGLLTSTLLNLLVVPLLFSYRRVPLGRTPA